MDHPEPAANPAIQKALDGMEKRPVRFLLNTHWHYDHVGGNAVYGPEAIIVAQENVRKRLMTQQIPFWSRTAIGPSPERAWPVITFRDMLGIHFAHANVVAVGDIFLGKASVISSADIEGIMRSLSAVVDRISDDAVIITGHGEASNRRDLAEFVQLLNETVALVRQESPLAKARRKWRKEDCPKYGSRGSLRMPPPRNMNSCRGFARH